MRSSAHHADLHGVQVPPYSGRVSETVGRRELNKTRTRESVVEALRALVVHQPVEEITVDQLAQAFTVYPSLSGSVGEAARRLHGQGGAEQVIY